MERMEQIRRHLRRIKHSSIRWLTFFVADQLAWGVIGDQTLYLARGFAGRFKKRFHAATLGPDAQAYLLERFRKRLNVRTLPRTLIV
jgi:hypothetical protein